MIKSYVKMEINWKQNNTVQKQTIKYIYLMTPAPENFKILKSTLFLLWFLALADAISEF